MVDISQKSIQMIIALEDSDQAYYDRTYEHWDWPGSASGATIGIGYDCGYVTHAECVTDWTGILSPSMIDMILPAIGLTGDRAHTYVALHHDGVTVTWVEAIQEFTQREIPKWEKRMSLALPNWDLLSPDCAGALLSLGYNRGTGGFNSPLPRYREMKNIRDMMVAQQWKLIPEQISAMARLWPNEPGLIRRRRLEAGLFAGGIAAIKAPAPPPVPPPAPPPTNQPGGTTMTQTVTGGGTANPLPEIEAALKAAEEILPKLLPVLGMFIPGLGAITPFLSLLPVAIQAVDTVQQATGSTTEAAHAAVVQTLTPGQPGAPALN